MTKSAFSLFLGAALLSVSSLTFAIPIDGGISFSTKAGSYFYFDDSQVVFDGAPGNAEVNQLTGDFLNYFEPGDAVTFSSFSFDPFSSGSLFWTAESTQNAGTTLQFNLAELTEVYQSTSGLNSLALNGTGVLSNGDAQQSALWNFTANEGLGAFSWSSSATVSAPAAVPEPGTVGLMGLALLLLGLRSIHMAGFRYDSA